MNTRSSTLSSEGDSRSQAPLTPCVGPAPIGESLPAA